MTSSMAPWKTQGGPHATSPPITMAFVEVVGVVRSPNSLFSPFLYQKTFVGLAWISPAQHEEFVLNYQLRLLERCGLNSYGCCESYDHKFDMLKNRVP